MSIDHPAIGPVGENNIRLFASLELSKSSWLLTTNSPGESGGGKVSHGSGGIVPL
jgi:hypothetical protein